MIHHLSIGVNDIESAAEFYDNVLATVGAKRVADYGYAVAYGKVLPEFWVQKPFNGGAPSVGNGTHIAFVANSKDEVRAFHRAALNAGATDDGKPGPREGYPPAYFGCFVRDLDGHKIEATFWDMERMK